MKYKSIQLLKIIYNLSFKIKADYVQKVLYFMNSC